MKLRSVRAVAPAVKTIEGAGFIVHRAFPTNALPEVDPFLMLDEMGPQTYAPGEAKGAPDHPHRGFETVTYMLAGEMEHKDSAGNAGRIGPGDVQWMTAGAGVIHSEMPSARIQREGGKVHGFQLWVNLPRAAKMMAPRYQEVPAARIPTAASSDGLASARVIAGEALGVKAVIDTYVPVTFLHFTLKPGARVEQPVSSRDRAFAHVISGALRAGARDAHAHEVVVFGDDGDAVTLEAGAEGAEFLLLAGPPLGEPIARYGPFVMNTEQEIKQAIDDYRSGRFGKIS